MPTKTMTVKELAEFLRLNPKTIRRMNERGELPRARRVAGRLRWSADEIATWFGRAMEPAARATA